MSETKNSRRVNNCTSSWGDCVALCCLLGIEWLQIILMALPSGGLIFWVMLELRHCMLRKDLFLRIWTFQRTVVGNLLMCWLCVHLPNNSYIALGILWLAKNPKANPLFYHLIVWLYRNPLWFWQRCKEMLGFNCGFSNCSKLSLVQILSPM